MTISFGKRTQEFPCESLGELRDCNSVLSDGDRLRSRLEEDGYLLVRGLYPREEVLKARRAIFDFALQHGKEPFKPGTDEMEGVFNPGGSPGHTMGSREVTHHPAVRAILEGPPLTGTFDRVFGCPSATFDYKWLRFVRPGAATGCHYDYVYMGRGSQRLLTCWVPFGDVTPDMGTLAICVGSHNLPSFEKLRQTYGRSDVDRDRTPGWISQDPQEVIDTFGGEWKTASFEAGDVIIFGMHTLHASLDNVSEKWRLTCDVRFQPAEDPFDERWIGEKPQAHAGVTDHSKKPLSLPEARALWGV